MERRTFDDQFLHVRDLHRDRPPRPRRPTWVITGGDVLHVEPHRVRHDHAGEAIEDLVDVDLQLRDVLGRQARVVPDPLDDDDRGGGTVTRSMHDSADGFELTVDVEEVGHRGAELLNNGGRVGGFIAATRRSPQAS